MDSISGLNLSLLVLLFPGCGFCVGLRYVLCVACVLLFFDILVFFIITLMRNWGLIVCWDGLLVCLFGCLSGLCGFYV